MTSKNITLFRSFPSTALIVLLCSFLFCEVYDLDIWWHLNIGREILSGGSVPTLDRFSIAGLGNPYHDSHWLFQVAATLSFRLLGMFGVQLLTAGIWGATFFYLYRSVRIYLSAPWSALLVFLSAMSCIERFLPRPEIVSYLMIAVFSWRLLAGRYRSRLELAVFFLLQVIWSNSHGLFVLGFFLVGSYWLTSIRDFKGENFRSLTRLLIALAIASLMTPFGVEGWSYAILLFTEAGANRPELFEKLGELSPLFGSASRSGLAFWFFLSLLIGSATLAISALRGFDKSERILPAKVARILLLLGMLALAFSGRRNMVLFALVAPIFCAEIMGSMTLFRALTRPFSQLLAGLLILAPAFLSISGFYYLWMQIPARVGLGATPSFFPHELPSLLPKLKQAGFKGPVYNSNTIGGAYAFYGYPDYLPLTDGRWELYDHEVLNEVWKSPQDPSLLESVIRRFKIQAFILQHASPESRALLPKLVSSSDWRLIHYDRAVSFWISNDLIPSLPKLNLSSSDGLPAKIDRFEDSLFLDLFYEGVGADELRLANLERLLSFHQDTNHYLESKGALENKLGRFSQAETTYQTLLKNDPKNLNALNELAYFAYRRGDLKAAESLLEKAVQLDPQKEDLRINLQRIRQANGHT